MIFFGKKVCSCIVICTIVLSMYDVQYFFWSTEKIIIHTVHINCTTYYVLYSLYDRKTDVNLKHFVTSFLLQGSCNGLYGNGANGGVHNILPGDSGDDEEEQVKHCFKQSVFLVKFICDTLIKLIYFKRSPNNPPPLTTPMPIGPKIYIGFGFKLSYGAPEVQIIQMCREGRQGSLEQEIYHDLGTLDAANGNIFSNNLTFTYQVCYINIYTCIHIYNTQLTTLSI